MNTTPTHTPTHTPPTRRRSFADVRYLALIAVAGLAATSIATFIVAIGKTITVFHDTIDDGWKNTLITVSVLEAVDTYLLAVVQLIVAIGLFELFIADLHMPPWLAPRSLDDLKKPIIDVLIVFVAVKGIERYLGTERPVDALAGVGAAAALIAALTLYRLLTSGHADAAPAHTEVRS